ncbi:unnamed protein product, partial [Vitis vinifera]|uniref:NADP-dependent oxidoreductase domain-containing protein n=1 Tax=Vitis vinifera TaxID=29760 RepID=D7TP65_VITVI
MNLFKAFSLLNLSVLSSTTQEYLHIAEEYSLHPVSLAIASVLRHPLVASAVFGATRSWQLQEVLNTCNVKLTSKVMAEIDKVHARFPNPCP